MRTYRSIILGVHTTKYSADDAGLLLHPWLKQAFLLTGLNDIQFTWYAGFHWAHYISRGLLKGVENLVKLDLGGGGVLRGKFRPCLVFHSI
jgi:hypothetical protein